MAAVAEDKQAAAGAAESETTDATATDNVPTESGTITKDGEGNKFQQAVTAWRSMCCSVREVDYG